MATTTYIGFYRPEPSANLPTQFREAGGPPREFATKINTFVENLPGSCKLVGSWTTSGEAPSVMVVEAESHADLQHINNYYIGWLTFTWHPAAATRRDH